MHAYWAHVFDLEVMCLTLCAAAGAALLLPCVCRQADLFFHRFYNLASTKTKRERREEERQRRKEEGDDADDDGLGADSGDDDEIDRLIEREEQVGGQGLGAARAGGLHGGWGG